MKEKVPCNVHPSEVTLQQLQTLNQPFNTIKSQIGTFANAQDFIARTGTQPPVNGFYKPWRDNAFLWNPDKQHAYYIFAYRDGSIDLLEGKDFQEPWRSSFTCQVLGLSVTNFLAEHKRSLRRVPKFVWAKFKRADALTLSFPDQNLVNAANYPVGELQPWDGSSPYFEIIDPETQETVRVQSDWNTLTFLRYDTDGSVVVEFTKDYIPAPPQAEQGIKLSDAELISAVTSVLASPLAPREKAAALRKLSVS